MSNHIYVHGKVVKSAEMTLINIQGEPTPVAVFTVVDIGLPYQQIEPTYFVVHYPKEAASLIAKYLVVDKEVMIDGVMRQKYPKDKNAAANPRYYLKADVVELLPVFASKKERSRTREMEATA